jgi:hypothetical protein
MVRPDSLQSLFFRNSVNSLSPHPVSISSLTLMGLSTDAQVSQSASSTCPRRRRRCRAACPLCCAARLHGATEATQQQRLEESRPAHPYGVTAPSPTIGSTYPIDAATGVARTGRGCQWPSYLDPEHCAQHRSRSNRIRRPGRDSTVCG